jgi:hypothetical protein
VRVLHQQHGFGAVNTRGEHQRMIMKVDLKGD